jgi:hypothetical protein
MSYGVKRGKLAKVKRTKTIALSDLDLHSDIQVESKVGPYVMLCANDRGRRIVEQCFPDVRWSTDERFMSGPHSAEWLFAHVRVTKLPAHLEKVKPLHKAAPDAIAFAVALYLQRFADPNRVMLLTGGWDEPPKVGMFGKPEDDAGIGLLAEYVPEGTKVWVPA